MKLTYIIKICTWVLILSACRKPPASEQASETESANASRRTEQNLIYLRSGAIVGGLSAHTGLVVTEVQYGQLRYNTPGATPISSYLARTKIKEKVVFYIFQDDGHFLISFDESKVTKDNAAAIVFSIEGKEFQFWGSEYYASTIKKSAENIPNRAQRLADTMQKFSNQKEIFQTNILNYFHNTRIPRGYAVRDTCGNEFARDRSKPWRSRERCA